MIHIKALFTGLAAVIVIGLILCVIVSPILVPILTDNKNWVFLFFIHISVVSYFLGKNILEGKK